MKDALMLGLCVLGLAFSLSGAIGIIRLPDVYSRIQASSKTITMGALPVLLALVVGEGVDTAYASRALLVGVLLLVVNPMASHALSRAAYKAGVPMWQGSVVDEAEVSATDGAPSAKRHQRPDPGRPPSDPGEAGPSS